MRFEDYYHYGFLCQGKQTGGNLIKIGIPDNEIHLYHFGYKKGFYLVVESVKPCYLKEIEAIAYAALLILGFFSGTLHLQETFIIASTNDRVYPARRTILQIIAGKHLRTILCFHDKRLLRISTHIEKNEGTKRGKPDDANNREAMEVQDTAHKGRGIFCHDEPFITHEPVARAPC